MQNSQEVVGLSTPISPGLLDTTQPIPSAREPTTPHVRNCCRDHFLYFPKRYCCWQIWKIICKQTPLTLVFSLPPECRPPRRPPARPSVRPLPTLWLASTPSTSTSAYVLSKRSIWIRRIGMLTGWTASWCHLQEESPQGHQGDQGVRLQVHGTFDCRKT